MKRATGFIIYKQVSGITDFLLLQTSYGIHHWTPPKGHVDPGESDLETAYRETEEEAGFLKKDLAVHDNMKIELNYEVEGKPKTTIYWLAKLIDPLTAVKLSDEHQDFKWLQLGDACEFVAFPDMQEALRKCHEYIEGHEK